MKIVIIRHGKVNMEWKKWYTSKQFDCACECYDCAPIIPIKQPAGERLIGDVYISSLQRSRQTAEQLFGEVPLIETTFLNEVPLKAFAACRIPLPLWMWNVGGRLQWLWQSNRQVECRRATQERARRLIGQLQEKGRDCTLVSHGFYMRTLIKELKRQGFVVSQSGLNISNLATIIAEK